MYVTFLGLQKMIISFTMSVHLHRAAQLPRDRFFMRFCTRGPY